MVWKLGNQSAGTRRFKHSGDCLTAFGARHERNPSIQVVKHQEGVYPVSLVPILHVMLWGLDNVTKHHLSNLILVTGTLQVQCVDLSRWQP